MVSLVSTARWRRNRVGTSAGTQPDYLLAVRKTASFTGVSRPPCCPITLFRSAYREGSERTCHNDAASKSARRITPERTTGRDGEKGSERTPFPLRNNRCVLPSLPSLPGSREYSAAYATSQHQHSRRNSFLRKTLRSTHERPAIPSPALPRPPAAPRHTPPTQRQPANEGTTSRTSTAGRPLSLISATRPYVGPSASRRLANASLGAR